MTRVREPPPPGLFNAGGGATEVIFSPAPAEASHLVRIARSSPIVFEPMALTQPEIAALKSKIRAACHAVDSAEYRTAASSHQVCRR